MNKLAAGNYVGKQRGDEDRECPIYIYIDIYINIYVGTMRG